MIQLTYHALVMVILFALFMGFMARKAYDSWRADRAWRKVWKAEMKKLPRAARY